MSLKYYDFIAERLVDCDLELLDGALKRNYGKSLADLCKAANKTRRCNLHFRDFDLIRFAHKDVAHYIGKATANESHETNVYEIICNHSTFDSIAIARLNGRELFRINANSYSKCQKIAIAALHEYLEDTKRRHLQRKNSREK